MACDLKNAKQGDKDTQLQVGGRYENGHGVDPDVVQAFDWYFKSAPQGLAEAQFNAAKAYEQGYGVLQDDSEALIWFVKAAPQGLAEAQFNAAGMYEHDRSSSRLFQGHEMASQSLCSRIRGKCLHDDSKTFQWFLTTAEHRNQDAQLLVANLYENGRGVA
ncbi:hypothetical protein BGX24_003226 [Mortierella sp. AD032]|nr:hypothetical protein BGX24_003226 [Mortierella sp. AD032]